MATDFLGEQLIRMAVNWRLTLAASERDVQKREYRPLLEKWGDLRFKRCVDRCIEKHKSGFFPTKGEFEDYDMGPGGGDTKTCIKCRDNGGYVYVTKFVEAVGHEVEFAKRCEHKHLGGE